MVMWRWWWLVELRRGMHCSRLLVHSLRRLVQLCWWNHCGGMVNTKVVLLRSNCGGMVMDLWKAGYRMVVGIFRTWAYIACLVAVLMSIGLTWRRSIGSVMNLSRWGFNDVMGLEASVRTAIKAAEGRVGTV